MNAIYPVEITRGSQVSPKEAAEKNAVEDDNNVVRTAQATHVAFNMLRQKAQMKNGWREFNQLLSTKESTLNS